MLVFRLVGGGEIRGTVESYDKECIGLKSADGPMVMLRKAQILYYSPGPATKPDEA